MLLDQLRKENIQAMKEKDIVKKGILSLLISAISLAQKESSTELSLDDEIAYVQKELKQTKETLQSIPADRTELIEETNRKIEILMSYLPAQMTEEEVVAALNALVKEKGLEPTVQNKGVMIKEMMATYKGKTDGRMINLAVEKLINS